MRIGRISKWLTPEYGACGACHTTWVFSVLHETMFTPCHGCFVLCEKCFDELTPTARLPYYRRLWEQWENTSEHDWTRISNAVLAGK